MKLRNSIYGCIHINNKLQVGFTNPTVTLIYKLIVATIAERTINVMQYNSKWASSYANFGIALQFISEWSSGCGFVKLFKKFPRPEDIKIIKLLEMIAFKTQIIFNMVLFSLQKSTPKASNLIFHFYFTNFNLKALNSLRSNRRAFVVVSISEVTKFHIWLHTYQ